MNTLTMRTAVGKLITLGFDTVFMTGLTDDDTRISRTTGLNTWATRKDIGGEEQGPFLAIRASDGRHGIDWALARFTHRLQGLFSSKQYSRLDGFDMTWRDSCEHGCRYSGLIGHLSDEHAFIPAKRIVENQQSPSELLNERAENFSRFCGFLSSAAQASVV
jgi:hypothetical protein